MCLELQQDLRNLVYFRLELDTCLESQQALRNLLVLVGSLTTCGYIEIKPSHSTGSLYQMPGFSLPQPAGKGNSLFLYEFTLLFRCFNYVVTNYQAL